MSERKIWVIEEIVSGDSISHRQSVAIYNQNQDGSWGWMRPDSSLSPEAQAEWDRVMLALSNVNGEDLRHVICGVGLMDHCLDSQNIKNYSA